MCAKVSKPLTSFQPASFLLVWDPIFGFKCMMYDVLFCPTYSCCAWLGTSGTCLGVGICIHMRTWCLDFDICDAFVLFFTNLLCSAWLGTTGMCFNVG